MANSANITQDYLRSILDYSPDTGIFVWKERTNVPCYWNPKHAGKIAGSIPTKISPAINIKIDKKLYYAHQLAWLYMFGEFVKDLDHKNNIKHDNRISNLRKATRSQQVANTRKRSDNKSGLKGVQWHKAGKKWQARVRVNGIDVFREMYDCPAAAWIAYQIASSKIQGEYARAF